MTKQTNSEWPNVKLASVSYKDKRLLVEQWAGIVNNNLSNWLDYEMQPPLSLSELMKVYENAH